MSVIPARLPNDLGPSSLQVHFGLNLSCDALPLVPDFNLSCKVLPLHRPTLARASTCHNTPA